MKQKSVYLGRFSPFHKGHQAQLQRIIDEYGIENVLVIVGSSTSINRRTPYSFEARKQMIQTIFPKVEVIGLPDANPEIEVFDGTTNDKWLDSLENLAKARGEKFTFIGGSEIDLLVLSKRFETEQFISRFDDGKCISGTAIRDAINSVDKRIWEIIIKENKYVE